MGNYIMSTAIHLGKAVVLVAPVPSLMMRYGTRGLDILDMTICKSYPETNW